MTVRKHITVAKPELLYKVAPTSETEKAGVSRTSSQLMTVWKKLQHIEIETHVNSELIGAKLAGCRLTKVASWLLILRTRMVLQDNKGSRERERASENMQQQLEAGSKFCRLTLICLVYDVHSQNKICIG